MVVLGGKARGERSSTFQHTKCFHFASVEVENT